MEKGKENERDLFSADLLPKCLKLLVLCQAKARSPGFPPRVCST